MYFIFHSEFVRLSSPGAFFSYQDGKLSFEKTGKILMLFLLISVQGILKMFDERNSIMYIIRPFIYNSY